MTFAPTVVIPAAPATIKDLKGVLVTLISRADLFEVVEVGSTSWLSALTKAQLWRVADILTVPGLSDSARWELVQEVRGERAGRKPAPMLSKILAETGASNVVGILQAA